MISDAEHSTYFVSMELLWSQMKDNVRELLRVDQVSSNQLTRRRSPQLSREPSCLAGEMVGVDMNVPVLNLLFPLIFCIGNR